MQEKNMNDRLHLYDLDKKQINGGTDSKETARLKELEELLAQCYN